MPRDRSERWRPARIAVAAAIGTALILSPGAWAGVSPGAPGDANCDAEIKLEDIEPLLTAIFEASLDFECAGIDVNGDARASAADVVAMIPLIREHATTSIAVLFLGDGMGPEHVRAGATMEDLAFEDFPVFVPEVDVSSLDTLADGTPTDSAAGATALATGVRVFNGEVGVSGDVRLRSLGELAAGAAKSVGIVTNSYLFDASPAAFVAHVGNRNRLAEIADQYLAAAPQVLMGAAPPAREFPDLEGFLARAAARGYTIARTQAELESLDLDQVDRLLVLFENQYDLGLGPVIHTVFPIYGTPRVVRAPLEIDPSLAQMAAAAVRVLARNPFGFLLFVENEDIDTLSHAGLSAMRTTPPIGTLVAGEVVELAASTTAVIDGLASAARLDDALLVVTADHETGAFTFPDDDFSAGTFPSAPNHTTRPVPLYASGNGAERLQTVSYNVDVFSAVRPAIR